MDIIRKWSLQMFAEGGEGAAAPGGNEGDAQSTAENAQEQTEQAAGQAAPEKVPFEELMKDPDYKAAMDRRIRSAVANRFKGVNAERAALAPLLQELGGKYGFDVSDPQHMDVAAIVKAYNEDESRLAQEAMENGYSVENWKEIKNARRITAERQREEQEAQKRQNFEKIWAESEALKQIYPGFSLEAELQDPRFGNLLAGLQSAGFTDAVRTAYESVHRDEIMSGAMQYAVQRTKQQVSNSIQAGMNRPAENGGTQAAAQTKVDPSKFSRQQIEEIRKRVNKGEIITFR